MIKKKKQTIQDNIKWLHDDSEIQKIAGISVISDAVNLVMEEYPAALPTELYDIFYSLSGNYFDLSLFAQFCAELVSRGYEDITEDTAFSPSLTVYLRNPITDKAYENFAFDYAGLRAIYAHDFKSACEDVYYDRADSCILPMENASDGLLMPFRNMLVKYELKIIAVTDVTTTDNQRQSLALVTGGSTDPEGNVIEVYVPALTNGEISELLNAAKTINCKTIRVTSVRASQVDRFDHHICFTSDYTSLSVLKFFLSARYPAYILLGQYKNLYSKGMHQK